MWRSLYMVCVLLFGIRHFMNLLRLFVWILLAWVCGCWQTCLSVAVMTYSFDFRMSARKRRRGCRPSYWDAEGIAQQEDPRKDLGQDLERRPWSRSGHFRGEGSLGKIEKKDHVLAVICFYGIAVLNVFLFHERSESFALLCHICENGDGDIIVVFYD